MSVSIQYALEADNENHNQRASIQNNLNAKRFSVPKDKNENVWHTPLLDLTNNEQRTHSRSNI